MPKPIKFAIVAGWIVEECGGRPNMDTPIIAVSGPSSDKLSAALVAQANLVPELVEALRRAIDAHDNPGKDYGWNVEADALLARVEGGAE